MSTLERAKARFENVSLRMGSRRFTRLTNGFSKKLDTQAAVGTGPFPSREMVSGPF
jgi:hypothetical protein